MRWTRRIVAFLAVSGSATVTVTVAGCAGSTDVVYAPVPVEVVDAGGTETAADGPGTVTAPETATAPIETAVSTTLPPTTLPPTTLPGGSAPSSGLAQVAVGDLAPDVGAALALISTGGPFASSSDGSVYRNSSRLLPVHEVGYYHLYSVSRSDAARRVVIGNGGERYLTQDRYHSFVEIVP